MSTLIGCPYIQRHSTHRLVGLRNDVPFLDGPSVRIKLRDLDGLIIVLIQRAHNVESSMIRHL